MDRKKLARSFFDRDTRLVARELIGCVLVRVVGEERLAGAIVETEAYIGATDPACHGFGHRRTKRTASLYQRGGQSYVYFVYGMHWCFNAVTRGPSSPEAVLVRALRPLEGLERMRRNRGRDASLQSGRDLSLTNGPAKLCAALAIDGACDRLSLAGNSLFIERGPCQPRAEEIVASPRIGVDYAGAAAKWNLRFSLQGDAYVSKPQPWKAGDKATRGSPSDFFAF